MYKVAYFEPNWKLAEYLALPQAFLPLPTKRQIQTSIQRLLNPLYHDRPLSYFNSGKSAIYSILKQWHVGPGDEVIIPTFLCTSAVQPIHRLRAIPIAADITLSDLNLSVESFKACITKKTKAVIVAHLYGNPAPIHQILDICRLRGIKVLDDAAQSFGASLNGTALGGWGDAGVISFSPGKSTVGIQGAIAITESLMAKPMNEVSLSSDAKRLANFIVRRCLRRWTQPMIELAYGRKNELPNPRVSCMASFNTAPMRKMDAIVARIQLKRVMETVLQQRYNNFALLSDIMAPIKSVQIVSAQQGESSYVKFVMILPSGMKPIFDQLQHAGLEVRASYLPLTLYKPSLAGTYHADTLGYRVLELPLDRSPDITRWMGELVRKTLEKTV